MAGETRKPLDKILCGGKFYRYVVACMHNCPNPHHCKEFWSFFGAKGLTPAEYYNEGGIGEKVMRRVVFDCDRCGKKDVDAMFGLYTEAGELPEHRLPEAKRGEMILQFGFGSQDVNRLCGSVLESLESAKGWQHYCSKCFQKVVDGVATILGEPRKAAPKPKEFEFADPNEPLESYDAPEYEGAEITGDEVALLEPVLEAPPPAQPVLAVDPVPAAEPPPAPVKRATSAKVAEPVKEPEALKDPEPAAVAVPVAKPEPVVEPKPVVKPEPVAESKPVVAAAPAIEAEPLAEAPAEVIAPTAESDAAEKGRRGRKPKPIALL